MTFEVCPTCGQSHPGCPEHRTLQGEWCTPAERAKGITQEMAVTALVNLHHSIRGKDCPREAAVGCATSAVMELKKERDELCKQNNEYRASADASGQTALMAHAAEMESTWLEAEERVKKAERECDALRIALKEAIVPLEALGIAYRDLISPEMKESILKARSLTLDALRKEGGK